MAWVAPQEEIEAALREHPAVIAGVEEVAQALRAVAVALARVRAFATGEYASSIIVVHEGGTSFGVVATAHHAWFVEAGTGIALQLAAQGGQRGGQAVAGGFRRGFGPEEAAEHFTRLGVGAQRQVTEQRGGLVGTETSDNLGLVRAMQARAIEHLEVPECGRHRLANISLTVRR